MEHIESCGPVVNKGTATVPELGVPLAYPDEHPCPEFLWCCQQDVLYARTPDELIAAARRLQFAADLLYRC